MLGGIQDCLGYCLRIVQRRYADRLGAVDLAHEVDLDHAAKLLDSRVLEGGVEPDCGQVGPRVDAAKLSRRIRSKGFELGEVRHIARHPEDPATPPPYLLNERLDP